MLSEAGRKVKVGDVDGVTITIAAPRLNVLRNLEEQRTTMLPGRKFPVIAINGELLMTDSNRRPQEPAERGRPKSRPDHQSRVSIEHCDYWV